MIFVVGPGHGAPGILSCLWLEGSLGHFYPQYANDKDGLHQLISTFSTSAGLPRLVSCITKHDFVLSVMLTFSVISTLRLPVQSTKEASWDMLWLFLSVQLWTTRISLSPAWWAMVRQRLGQQPREFIFPMPRLPIYIADQRTAHGMQSSILTLQNREPCSPFCM